MTLPLPNQAVCEELGCFPKMHISDPWGGHCALWPSAQDFRPLMEKHQLPDAQEENVKQPHSPHYPKPDLLSGGLEAIKTKEKNELPMERW